MEMALFKECVLKGAWLYQLGINHLAAHTCLIDLHGLADMTKKDHPAKCQEKFCEAPLQESFNRWCLASTLDTRHRSAPTSQEKSFGRISAGRKEPKCLTSFIQRTTTIQ